MKRIHLTKWLFLLPLLPAFLFGCGCPIFDEIDSGVSGEVADKMGNLMKTISRSLQVITITHLPQIASKADAHYLAFKLSDKDVAHSNIRMLKQQERVDEIAKMLSGEEMSEAAVENARELLRSN